jgi:hypothetical protein
LLFLPQGLKPSFQLPLVQPGSSFTFQTGQMVYRLVLFLGVVF